MHEANAGETRSETRSETRTLVSGAELGEFADQEFVPVQLTVNGRRVRQLVEARLLLSDFLRGTLGLTGTHVGCEHGVCGACTVMVDGVSARSCLMLAAQTDGCTVQTVEGLGSMQAMSPLQQAFQQCHGLQCGFCTPGMLITATDMLANDHPADEAAVREGLSGNLCRCTGYQHIVQAVMQVAMQGGAVASNAGVNTAVNAVQS
jgi:aerobic-type carbon monoxide dehydrogenase small subunit (CoxS/CutS family)